MRDVSLFVNELRCIQTEKSFVTSSSHAKEPGKKSSRSEAMLGWMKMRQQLKVSYNSLAYKYNVLYKGETTERREEWGVCK